MFIVQGITPATKTESARPELVASFERAYDAGRLTRMYNPLNQEQKISMVNKEIVIDQVEEKGEEVSKTVKVRNEYTIMYVEEI